MLDPNWVPDSAHGERRSSRVLSESSEYGAMDQRDELSASFEPLAVSMSFGQTTAELAGDLEASKVPTPEGSSSTIPASPTDDDDDDDDSTPSRNPLAAPKDTASNSNGTQVLNGDAEIDQEKPPHLPVLSVHLAPTGSATPRNPASPNYLEARTMAQKLRCDSSVSLASSRTSAGGSTVLRRRRTHTQIFNDVLRSSNPYIPIQRGEELPPAMALIVTAACVASKLASTTFLFPPVEKLMRSDADTEQLVSRHEEELRHMRPFKVKVEEFITKNNRSQLADMIQSVLAIVSSSLYVYESYEVRNVIGPPCGDDPFQEVVVNGSSVYMYVCDDDNASTERDGDIEWIRIVETCFALIFLIDYLVRFFIAPSKLRYFFSLFPMVDLITVVPVFLAWRSVGATSFGFIRVVRLLRLLRVLKAYRIVGTSRGEWTAIKQANVLIFTVVSLLFVASGMIQMVEREQDLTFGDAVYFMVVTMATVGYGDIAPQTTLGKVVMILLILTAIVLIPVQTRGLIDLLAEQPKELFKNIPGGDQGYVILAGHHLTHDEVYMFVKEFYHPVHNTARPPGVIVVSKETMTAKMRVLLESPCYKRRMRFVLGSLLDDDTLRKIKAEKAKACFLLATGQEREKAPPTDATAPTDRVVIRESQNTERQGIDTVCALQTLNFRSFTKYQVETYCLLNHSQGKSAATAASADYIVSLEESRLKLMAQSCICPGLSTLVINFITSFRESSKRGRAKLRQTRTPGDLNKKNKTGRKAVGGCCTPSTAQDDDEIGEYKRGMSHVVYEMQVPKQLAGRNFIEVAIAVYMKFEITLLGVINRPDPPPAPNATSRGSTASNGSTTREGAASGVASAGIQIPVSSSQPSAPGNYNMNRRQSTLKGVRDLFFEENEALESSQNRGVFPFTPRRPGGSGSTGGGAGGGGGQAPSAPAAGDTKPGFNFVLNPGHRYRLRQDDILAVIAIDQATCEVCQEYDGFPLDEGGDPESRLRRQTSFYGVTQTASLHLTRRRFGNTDYPSRGPRTRTRLKSVVWLIISLQKLRPVRSSLPERTVLDVNAPAVKYRNNLHRSEGEMGGGTASPGSQSLNNFSTPKKAFSLGDPPQLAVGAGFGDVVGRERGMSLTSTGTRPRGFSLTAQGTAEHSAQHAMAELELQAKIAELTAQLVTREQQLREMEADREAPSPTPDGGALAASHRSAGTLFTDGGHVANHSASLISDLRSQLLAKELLLKDIVQQVNPTFAGFRRTDWRKEGVFKDHIIVTGGQRNLAQFIRALKRSLCATKTPLKTVLYLAPTPPVTEVWNRVSHYRYFYFCQGDPRITNDLYRAGLEEASSLVILQADAQEKYGEVDADVVFITMAAINLCPVDEAATKAVVESNDQPISEGLQSKLNDGPIRNRKGLPVLRRANGKPLFIIAELTSSTSVKFFNDFDVLQTAKSFGLNAKERREYRMLLEWKKRQSGQDSFEESFVVDEDIEAFSTSHQASPFYAAGFLISNQMFCPILPHSFYSPSLIRIVEQFMQGSLNQYGSFLGSVPVPEHLVGQEYGVLFYNMSLKMEMIPLGLYRAPGGKTKSPLPYVFTNPPKTTIVHEGDMVYVLQSGKDVDEGDSDTDSDTDLSSSSARPYKPSEPPGPTEPISHKPLLSKDRGVRFGPAEPFIFSQESGRTVPQKER